MQKQQQTAVEELIPKGGATSEVGMCTKTRY